MDDLELIALLVCLFVGTLALVGAIVNYESKQKRRKPNIRVPRETLWARTNRYHRGY